MNKKELTDADIRTKFITPALVGEGGAGWDVMTQVREEYFFTDRRLLVRGKTVKRGEWKKAGFFLANGSMSSNQSGEGEVCKAPIEVDPVDCMVALPGRLVAKKSERFHRN